MTVKIGKEEQVFKKILVCLDGSALSEQILTYVSKETADTGKKVVLLRVVPPSLGDITAVAGVMSSTPMVPPTAEQLAAEENEAKAYLDSKRKSLETMGIDVKCVVIVGSPGEEIVNYAHKNEFDLIAVATHGRSGLKRVIFGSVAEHVIKNSRLPILLIKPK